MRYERVIEEFKVLNTATVQVETLGRVHYTFPGLKFGGYELIEDQLRHGARQVTFLNGEGVLLSVPVNVLDRVVLLLEDGRKEVLWDRVSENSRKANL